MEFGMVPRLRLASTCGSYKRNVKISIFLYDLNAPSIPANDESSM